VEAGFELNIRPKEEKLSIEDLSDESHQPFSFYHFGYSKNSQY
jgi:hypothetical protein